VYGSDGSANRARLQNDAALISALVQSKMNVQLITSELIDTQDQLLAMYDLTQGMREYLDLNKVLEQLAGETARLVNVEATFVMIQRVDGSWLIKQYPKPILGLDSLDYMLDFIKETGQEFMISGADSSEQSSAVRNLLLIPIELRESTQAALGLVNKLSGDFLSPVIKLARAIAEYAGARIENAILYQENLNQTKLQTEMELAKQVQLNLLPQRLPSVPGIDFWAGSRPASMVGGDFYDFLSQEKRPFIFTVGDISGKGLPAALLMAMTRTAIRAKVHDSLEATPEIVVGRANTELYDDFTDVNMFATVFIGQYDPSNREILYANAGHSPVIYCPIGGRARLLEADGTAVGILPESFAENQRLDFSPGDVLIIATDGLCEAHNGQDEMYGYDRMLHLTESLSSESAQTIADNFYRSVNEFSIGKPQDDDQTIMVLKGVGE
jgi:sigma-B regulation protein RsbU (phosphoserine phosphatase)